MKPYNGRAFPRYNTDERRNSRPFNRRRDEPRAIADSLDGSDLTTCGLCLRSDCVFCGKGDNE